MNTKFLSAILASALLAGCGTALKETAPVKGSIVDRTLALQESFFAIMEGSDTASQAAKRIHSYCDRNRQAIAQIAIDAGAFGDDMDAVAAFGHELGERMQDLLARTTDALEGKDAMVSDPMVLTAIGECMVPSDEPAAGASREAPIVPDEGGTDGDTGLAPDSP